MQKKLAEKALKANMERDKFDGPRVRIIVSVKVTMLCYKWSLAVLQLASISRSHVHYSCFIHYERLTRYASNSFITELVQYAVDYYQL